MNVYIFSHACDMFVQRSVEVVMKPPFQTLHTQKKRKRAKRLHWSTRNRYKRSAVISRVLHLPTRRTLTYAEAQQFVDVYINGSVSRLSILEPLSVVDDCDIKKYNSECCSVYLPSETKSEVVTSSLCDSNQQVHELPLSAAVTVTASGRATSAKIGAYYRHVDKTPQELDEEVEYDTDEQVFFVHFCLFI